MSPLSNGLVMSSRVAIVTVALTAATTSRAFAYPAHANGHYVAIGMAPDTQHVTIKISGMYCESCEASVRTMLKRTRGVYSATVDVKLGLATVAYDPRQTTPQRLADVVNRLGYKATVAAPTKAAAGI